MGQELSSRESSFRLGTFFLIQGEVLVVPEAFVGVNELLEGRGEHTAQRAVIDKNLDWAFGRIGQSTRSEMEADAFLFGLKLVGERVGML